MKNCATKLFASILLLFVYHLQILAQTNTAVTTNPFFNSKGKLIIIGGGTIPDSLFTFFANYCGGKDQPIVYIPTATEDEEFIQKGEHLLKFSTRGFTHLSTIQIKVTCVIP